MIVYVAKWKQPGSSEGILHKLIFSDYFAHEIETHVISTWLLTNFIWQN